LFIDISSYKPERKCVSLQDADVGFLFSKAGVVPECWGITWLYYFRAAPKYQNIMHFLEGGQLVAQGCFYHLFSKEERNLSLGSPASGFVAVRTGGLEYRHRLVPLLCISY